MKLLITGASGFLGRHIVAQAIRRGHDVRAQVRPMSDIAALGWEDHPNIQIVRADLRNKAGLAELVEGVDAVISNAACKAGDFYTQFAGTVITTENILEAMAAANVKRLISISTFSVYDYLKLKSHSTLDEGSPLDDNPANRDEYAQTKLVQEKLARGFAQEHDGQVTILRPGVIYGKDNLYTARLGMKLGSKRWLLIGPGTALPMTYVENCAQAIIDAAQKDQAVGQTYNIIDDDPPTCRQYLRALNKHQKPRVRALPMPWLVMRGLAALAHTVNKLLLGGRAKIPSILRPAALHARSKPLKYTNKHLKDSLGWSPRFALDEAIARSTQDTDPAAIVPQTDDAQALKSDHGARTCA